MLIKSIVLQNQPHSLQMFCLLLSFASELYHSPNNLYRRWIRLILVDVLDKCEQRLTLGRIVVQQRVAQVWNSSDMIDA